VSDQIHGPAALPSGKEPSGTHWIGGWVGPTASLNSEAKRKIKPLQCPYLESNPGHPFRMLVTILSYKRSVGVKCPGLSHIRDANNEDSLIAAISDYNLLYKVQFFSLFVPQGSDIPVDRVSFGKGGGRTPWTQSQPLREASNRTKHRQARKNNHDQARFKPTIPCALVVNFIFLGIQNSTISLNVNRKRMNFYFSHFITRCYRSVVLIIITFTR
jgi:hypothetical protein